MKKILIIQTAFIGDVILATSLVETIRNTFGNEFSIDMLVRKGNESLLEGHPYIRKTLVWDKKNQKYKKLLSLSKMVRNENYDLVYNLQRFGSTGFLTWRSKAKTTVGFANNPFAFRFGIKVKHEIGTGRHEIERNGDLVSASFNNESLELAKPRLYPSVKQKEQISNLVRETPSFVVLAPASVWFTKQLPREKWIELIRKFKDETTVYLIGGPSDESFIQAIISESESNNCLNMAGKLNLLASAELISRAKRTFVNDSAPLHLASAMNAPVTAFFCSTIPAFGFGPLSADFDIKEVQKKLECRPCGLHGFKACPKGHFECGKLIDVNL